MSVTIDGVEYEEVTTEGRCTGCAFTTAARDNWDYCDAFPPCQLEFRTDGRDVIFVRKEGA